MTFAALETTFSENFNKHTCDRTNSALRAGHCSFLKKNAKDTASSLGNKVIQSNHANPSS